MASGDKIRSSIRNLIRQRASGLCEYCHTSERWQYVPFTIDHVIPISRGGTDDDDNLALSCFHCNRKKGDKMTAKDPSSGKQVTLFNPRIEEWRQHFIWSSDGLFIIGNTAIGRATIMALEMNRERAVNIRLSDRSVGRHPPIIDPVQKPDY